MNEPEAKGGAAREATAAKPEQKPGKPGKPGKPRKPRKPGKPGEAGCHAALQWWHAWVGGIVEGWGCRWRACVYLSSPIDHHLKQEWGRETVWLTRVCRRRRRRKLAGLGVIASPRSARRLIVFGQLYVNDLSQQSGPAQGVETEVKRSASRMLKLSGNIHYLPVIFNNLWAINTFTSVPSLCYAFTDLSLVSIVTYFHHLRCNTNTSYSGDVCVSFVKRFRERLSAAPEQACVS